MTDVLPFAALMYIQSAETKFAFVFLSLYKNTYIYIEDVWQHNSRRVLSLTTHIQLVPLVKTLTSVTKLNLPADVLWVVISDWVQT